MHSNEVLKQLGISEVNAAVSCGRTWHSSSAGRSIASQSPIDGATLAKVALAAPEDYEAVLKRALTAGGTWAALPAPKRGEIVRQIGQAFREAKEPLGSLVSREMGKSLQEGLGEVQEIIDICDFAVGLSRQLYGLSMHSERPEHRMFEQWQPLGVVGIISAFNFPVAVWAWNAMIAAVCGNVSVWKPSEKTPLCAVACFELLHKVLAANDVPPGVFNLVVGEASIGELISHDHRIPLVSATGSTAMGKKVGTAVASRLGRSLLELGGNNAIIITSRADLKLALPAVAFGAVGTAGQRCTTTRRLICHRDIYPDMRAALLKAYASLRIGDPLAADTHVGPLIDRAAVAAMQDALRKVKAEGGTVLYGGEVLEGRGYESGCYVRPALVEAPAHAATVQQETFAPILYLIPYDGNLQDAIAMQNAVPQGLSSAIFTDSIREAEIFLSQAGSDCGIANVNIGTSGAEIGGAFGGEKETGGGRESGSDAWKAYMRRQTVTLNWGTALPLAQGIKFNIA